MIRIVHCGASLLRSVAQHGKLVKEDSAFRGKDVYGVELIGCADWRTEGIG